MTIRNLNALFKPTSIAIIGGSRTTSTKEVLLIRNLTHCGFKGPIMPVNPYHRALQGILAYPKVQDLPLTPDLALLTVPLQQTPALIDELGARGTRGVVLFSEQTYSQHTETSWQLRQAMLEAAKPYLLRLIGPDHFGVAVPKLGLNATLNSPPPLPGHIALISQSSAILRSVADWAYSRNIGFSHLVSVGEKIDVDFGDVLDYCAREGQVRSILVYLEHIRDGRKFMSAARAAARIKPVVVMKPRNFGAGPVEDAVYDAAFRRAGMLRVDRIEHLFNAAETLDTLTSIPDNRLAIVGNSRSIGLLASDALFAVGGRLAELAESTRSELAQIGNSVPYTDNPVDVGDHADPQTFGRAVKILLDAPNIDAVLALFAPSADHDARLYAEATIAAAENSRRLLLTSWVGADAVEPARRLFKQKPIATYNNPGDAAQAFVRHFQYLKYKELLMETPPSVPEVFHVDKQQARKILRAALDCGRRQLQLVEAIELLAAYGIPVVPTHFAADPVAAARIGASLSSGAAIKILSPDIDDKTCLGGIRLGLHGKEHIHQAAESMLQQCRTLAPDAIIDGFAVQPMLHRSSAYQLLIGVRTGQHFGPVLYCGHGGTETAVIEDIAYGLPPLNIQLAKELLARTRIHRLLQSDQGRNANIDAVVMSLIAISQLVIDHAEIVEMDINPLWVNSVGVRALDARIVLRDTNVNPVDRLAIHPYPKELEQVIDLPDQRRLLIRPIVPEDEPALRAMVRRLPAEDLRLRFFQPIRELSHAMAARLSQLDYCREMAFLITEPKPPGQADIFGVVRLTADPDLDKAEYAIIIDRNMAGLGLGPLLMRRIIDYARKRGIQEMYGEVLRENESMLKLDQALGFTITADPEDRGVMRVSLRLQESSD